MMDNNTLLILMASLFVVTVLIILIIVLNNLKKTNDLNNELSRSIYEIRSNISRDFMDLDARLNNEFHDFSDRVNSNIIQSNKASNEVFYSISEKMAKINEAQDSLNEMSKDIIRRICERAIRTFNKMEKKVEWAFKGLQLNIQFFHLY